MFKNNLAYSASAGSGKTFMLVVRYLSLVFMGADTSKILALTFTNKAAYEMKERIISTLEDLQNKGELEEIVKITGLCREDILSSREKILEEFLDSDPKIMTIDKFFTKILRKFSLFVSLMPDFSMSASQHELKLLSRFLYGVRNQGKSSTLIALSMQSDKRLENIFALLNEFYIKKHELKNLKFQKQDIDIFKNEAMQYLEKLQKIVLKCDKASTTAKNGVTAKDFNELLKKAWLKRDSFDYSTFKKCYTPQMDDILVKIKQNIKNYHEAKEQNFFYGLSELVNIYEDAKKSLYMQESELGFDDVSMLVYHILKEIDDSEFLYFRLDSQIQHILLDEFQDTSILQYEILKPLIEEAISGEGISKNGSFFFVGDTKQSIYRFRGGVSALFENVKKQHNTQLQSLLVNYRSQKEVVKFVNQTFLNKIKNYVPQTTKKENTGGYVEVLQDDDVIEQMCIIVKKLLHSGADINNIAVLCATNGDGEVAKEAMKKHNIHVLTQTTTKLINQKAVKATIEYLKYLYFKEDICKYNFYSLIGRKPQDIEKQDLSKYTVFEIVKNLIDKYELFNDDFLLVRFLDALKNYQDIESFLFEYERLDMEAPPSDINGVKVLTVHKSKGLEFEHVIIIDRLKKTPPSKNPIIYEYDEIKLKNVYLRASGRDDIDNKYANALKKEKELQKEDSLNSLYVAFTRAKRNLFIIKKPKDSIFKILDLACEKNGTIQCTDKNETSFVKSDTKPIHFQELYYGMQNDIIKNEDQTQEDLKSINFGLAMHYMLEMLEDFTPKSIPHAKNMMLNKYGHILDNDEISDIQNRIEMLLDFKNFIKLTKGRCYKEKALKYNNNLKYVDLLIENNDTWTVIDYKSSISFAQHHQKQVKYYTKAISNITNTQTNGYVCYLLKDEIIIKKIY